MLLDNLTDIEFCQILSVEKTEYSKLSSGIKVNYVVIISESG